MGSKPSNGISRGGVMPIRQKLNSNAILYFKGILQKQVFTFSIDAGFLMPFGIPSVPNLQAAVLGLEGIISGTTDDLFAFFVKDNKGIGLSLFFFSKGFVKIGFNSDRRRDGRCTRAPKACRPWQRLIGRLDGIVQGVGVRSYRLLKSRGLSKDSYSHLNSKATIKNQKSLRTSHLKSEVRRKLPTWVLCH